ncbi:MAG TPA: hypothetical protein PKL34_06260, partial [Candidatus Cloacimonadota bacterium]|nr:hypothetical protein [Candidatus Cloacimonadota bacterium]
MKHIIILTGLILLSAGLWAEIDFRVDAELGMAFPGYNDVRIPNDDIHSMFSLKDDLSVDPVFSSR